MSLVDRFRVPHARSVHLMFDNLGSDRPQGIMVRHGPPLLVTRHVDWVRVADKRYRFPRRNLLPNAADDATIDRMVLELVVICLSSVVTEGERPSRAGRLSILCCLFVPLVGPCVSQGALLPRRLHQDSRGLRRSARSASAAVVRRMFSRLGLYLRIIYLVGA